VFEGFKININSFFVVVFIDEMTYNHVNLFRILLTWVIMQIQLFFDEWPILIIWWHQRLYYGTKIHAYSSIFFWCLTFGVCCV
jgi:hypothetical protein